MAENTFVTRGQDDTVISEYVTLVFSSCYQIKYVKASYRKLALSKTI